MPETSDARSVDVGQEFMADFKVEVIKAQKSEDGTRGNVTALVSAYNKPYRLGFATMHHIENGAFAASLADNPNVPLFWQHNWSSTEQPPIGHALGREEADGLVIEGQFYLDTESGRSVFNAMKAGAIREWSIGYRIGDHEVEEAADGASMDTVFVKEAELLEASAVLRGANPHTETLKVASEQDVLRVLADLTETVTEVVKTQALMVATLAQYEDRMTSVVAAQASDETVRVEAGLAALAGQFTPAKTETETAAEEAEVEVEEVEVEAASCWFLGCEDAGTHEVAGGDLTACDEHKIAGSKRVPQMRAASSGEEGQVESTVEGGEPTPVAASGSVPRIPDFLPPSDPSDEVDTDDLTAQSRVMRAWQRAADDAQIRQLTSR